MGYGLAQTRQNGKIKGHLAHRVAYEFCIGKIPSNMTIDHLCRNRLCVNPKHLEVCTRGENTLRGDTITGKFSRATECVNGHPFDSKNTYFRKSGGRTCLACNKIRKIKYRMALV